MKNIILFLLVIAITGNAFGAVAPEDQAPVQSHCWSTRVQLQPDKINQTWTLAFALKGNIAQDGDFIIARPPFDPYKRKIEKKDLALLFDLVKKSEAKQCQEQDILHRLNALKYRSPQELNQPEKPKIEYVWKEWKPPVIYGGFD